MRLSLTFHFAVASGAFAVVAAANDDEWQYVGCLDTLDVTFDYSRTASEALTPDSCKQTCDDYNFAAIRVE